MDKDKDFQSVPIVYNQSSITLPFDETALKDFIISLLGQPETIEGVVEGSFEFDIGKFEHLDKLIDNRISSQNQSALLEFRAKLLFNNDSSISFNGVRSFLEYRELRPIICTGFIFTWSYLIKFSNKEFSEKQEISISSIKSKLNRVKQKSSLHAMFDLGFEEKLPVIDYAIRCTNQGWGIEIADLIHKYLLTSINLKTASGLRRFLIENFRIIERGLFFVFFLAFIWFLVEGSSSQCSNLSSQIEQFTNKDISFENKVEFLMKLVVACGPSNKSSLVFVVIASTLIPFSIFSLPLLIFRLLKSPAYKFLLFTQASITERDEYFRKKTSRKSFLVVTVLTGLVLGVTGNYIYTWLVNYFTWLINR